MKRNPVGRLRELERRANETGANEDVLAYATALLRAGEISESYEPFVLAAQALGPEWFLVPAWESPNFVLGRLIYNDALLLIGWPDLLSNTPIDWSDVEGEDEIPCFVILDATWLDLPAQNRPWNFGGVRGKPYLRGEGEFRMPPSVNRMLRDTDPLGKIQYAAHALPEPGPRLLGVMALSMDLGAYPRGLFPVSWFVDYMATEEGLDVEEDWDVTFHEVMNPLFYRAWIPIERDQGRAIDYVDDSMRSGRQGRWLSVSPLHAFNHFPDTPFPHLLREFGFDDESSNLDPWALAMRAVGTPPNLGINWPERSLPLDFELDELGNPLYDDEEYAVVVRCLALHPADRDYLEDEPRFAVFLGSTSSPAEASVLVSTAEHVSGLHMILVNLGL